jgi:hypothetical protein
MFSCRDDTDNPDIVPWHREETGPTRSARPAGDRRGRTTGGGRLIGRGCMTSPIPHRSQPALRSGRSPRRGQRPWPTRGEHINNRFNCRQVGVDKSVRGRVSGWVRTESRCHATPMTNLGGLCLELLSGKGLELAFLEEIGLKHETVLCHHGAVFPKTPMKQGRSHGCTDFGFLLAGICQTGTTASQAF